MYKNCKTICIDEVFDKVGKTLKVSLYTKLNETNGLCNKTCNFFYCVKLRTISISSAKLIQKENRNFHFLSGRSFRSPYTHINSFGSPKFGTVGKCEIYVIDLHVSVGETYQRQEEKKDAILELIRFGIVRNSMNACA